MLPFGVFLLLLCVHPMSTEKGNKRRNQITNTHALLTKVLDTIRKIHVALSFHFHPSHFYVAFSFLFFFEFVILPVVYFVVVGWPMFRSLTESNGSSC